MTLGMVLTRRGVGFLVTAFACFVLAPMMSLPALLTATALLLALVVFSAVFVLVGHSSIRIDRTFAPEVIDPGQSTEVTVTVSNLSLLPCLESHWEDTLPPGLSAEASGTLPSLGGSRGHTSRVRFTYRLQGLRRGRHHIGPLSVHVLDPFGLVFRRHRFGGSAALIVLPKRVQLWPLRPHGADNDGASRPAPQHVGVGDDDVIARAYLPGDAMKRLHWKATAHRGELMVRQEEQQVNPRAGVVIDRDALSFGTVRDRQGAWEYSAAFEWAVTATASVIVHLVRVGYVVVARSPGGALDRHVSEAHDTVEDALIDLATIEPTDAADLDVETGERTTFVVLGRPSADRAREWVQTLSSSSTVLAFVGRGTSEEALDILSAARWRCISYNPNDEVAERWSELDGTRSHAAR